MKSRFRQADREARITLWVYAAFFVWWTVGAFGLGPWAEVTMWGMPAWFLVSCVLGYPLVCLVLWLVLRSAFKHMPLSADGSANGNADSTADDGAENASLKPSAAKDPRP